MFKKCAACHNADKGGANALGPNLWGVLGKPIGKGHGFAFSDALEGEGRRLGLDTMSDWLSNPKKFAPGHQDDLRRPRQPEDRANIIAFLNSQERFAAAAAPAAPAGREAPTASSKRHRRRRTRSRATAGAQ